MVGISELHDLSLGAALPAALNFDPNAALNADRAGKKGAAAAALRLAAGLDRLFLSRSCDASALICYAVEKQGGIRWDRHFAWNCPIMFSGR